MDIRDFKVGQTVYRIDRTSQKEETKEETVTKVGRKYVYTGTRYVERKFCLLDDENRYLTESRDWGSPDLLFASKEDLDVYLEYQELQKWKRSVSYMSLTIDQLRAMKDIAEGKEYAPVVRAHWIYKKAMTAGECSRCGANRNSYEGNYCGNCGATIGEKVLKS